MLDRAAGEALLAKLRALSSPVFSRMKPRGEAGARSGLALSSFATMMGSLALRAHTAIDSPFYKLAPHWALIPLVGLAAMATIIASQELISGVFSLTRQAMQMGLCPRMRVVPTSSDEAGQIYVPTANWLLMAGTLLVVVLFKTSESLAGLFSCVP